MVWFAYALFAAVFTAIAGLVMKKSLLKEHAMEFSAVIALFAVVISLPMFLMIDYSILQLPHLVMLFFVAIPGAVAFLLVAKAMRHMDVSKSLPLLGLAPGIAAVMAFGILAERITGLQIGGIVLLILGSYILETRKGRSLFEPLRTFKRSKYIHYIILALLLYGLTSVFDRFMLHNAGMEPMAYIAFAQVFLAFHFFVMLKLFHNGFKGIKHGIKRAGPWLFLFAVVLVGARVMQANAIKLAALGPVLAIKRASVLFTTIIGGGLFHEKELVRRSIASLVIVIGAILVII